MIGCTSGGDEEGKSNSINRVSSQEVGINSSSLDFETLTSIILTN
jgi:hypothetical protein